MGLYGFMEGQTPSRASADLPAEAPAGQGHLAQMLAGDFYPLRCLPGPIKDNQGNVILADGVALEQLGPGSVPALGRRCTTCMYWWAEGVTGRAASAGVSISTAARGL